MYKVYSYSVDIAKVFGPNSAIFINMLMLSGCNKLEDIIDLDRFSIFNITGIDLDKQLEVEKLLSKLGIITIKQFKGNDNKNHYSLNIDRMTSIMSNPAIINDIFIAPKIEKKKEKSKESKKEATLKQLKNCIDVQDSVLRQYLCDWIDSVMERNYITKQGVKINIEELLKFSTDQETLINVVNIAIKNSYRDLTWAMNRFKEQNQNKKSGNNFANYSEIKGNSANLVKEAF